MSNGKMGVSRLVIVGVLVVIILVAVGVGYWYSLEQERLRQEKIKQTIIIGTTDKITKLDPAKAYDFYTWEVMNNIGEGLMKYKPGTTELEWGLATNYTVSSSGLNYTFTLREGLKFNDGTPLNATAVKWSLERVTRLDDDPAWLVSVFVQSVAVVDTYKIKINLKDAVSFFPALVATPPYFPISSKAFPANEVKDVTDGWHGPYKVTKWIKDEVLEMEANPDYYGTQPKSKFAVVKFIKDAVTLRFAIQSGTIDVAWKTLRPIDISDLKTVADLNFTEVPGPYIRYNNINTNRNMHSTAWPSTDAKFKLVRQAIAAAINRTEIAETVFMGTVDPLYSMVPMGMWGHTDEFKVKYGDANITLARSLLTQAGYSETNKFNFKLWYTPTHYGDTEADVATIIKKNLEATGMMEVTLDSAEWATYAGEWIEAGTMPIFLLGWYPDYIDPDDYTTPFVAVKAGDYGMGTFYWNATLFDILTQARTKTTIAERTALYGQVQKTFAEDVPHIPLFQGTLQAFALSNVKGLVLDATMLFRYYLVYKE